MKISSVHFVVGAQPLQQRFFVEEFRRALFPNGSGGLNDDTFDAKEKDLAEIFDLANTALKQRVKIEPIIGHLKCDHRMNRCRYKGKAGDTVNVIWATLAWNTKKITQLARAKGERLTRKALPLAA